MTGGSIYPAPDEIEGLPVASKHIILTWHALVVSFYQNKVFSLDIFIWHFAFLPLLPRCLGLCWLLRIQEGWIFCHQYLFRLKSVFTLFLFHAFLVLVVTSGKRVGGVPVGDLVLPVGDRQLGGRPHSLRVLSFNPGMGIWIVERYPSRWISCTFIIFCKGEFNTQPDDGLVGFDKLAVPADLDCRLTGCQV